jgi:hypothetical protein
LGRPLLWDVTTGALLFTLRGEGRPDAGGRAAARQYPWGPGICEGGEFVSIVRVGLSETKNFAEGYDAIFGKKDAGKDKRAEANATAGKAKKKKTGQKKK